MNSISFFKALLMKELNEKNLPGNQEKIAQAAEPKDKITAADFEALRAKKDVKKEGEDNDNGGGTLKIEKEGDKYYWTWNPKSGKSQKSDAGFESKADAQRDFMRKSKYMKESEGQDHEVSMAQNSLKSIISSASQLMNMLGQDEKDIPAWIQDHITNAENYINQASKNYHEYHNGGEDMDELPVGNEEEPVDDMTLQGLMETILSEYEVHYYMDGGKCYKKDDEGNKQEVNASECKRRGIREAKKPSAGLSKKQKSAIVKKAKSGKDMGKKGKGFEKIVKAAKKSGADNPEAVAGAAFWKGQAKKAK